MLVPSSPWCEKRRERRAESGERSAQSGDSEEIFLFTFFELLHIYKICTTHVSAWKLRSIRLHSKTALGVEAQIDLERVSVFCCLYPRAYRMPDLSY